MHTLNVKFTGLTCEACAKLVKRRIEKIEGVEEARVRVSGETEIVADRMISKKEVKDMFFGSDYEVL